MTTGCATRQVSPSPSKPVAAERRFDIDQSQPLTTKGWIEIQISRIVSEGKSNQWQSKIILHSEDGEIFVIEPLPSCKFDVPADDKEKNGINFRIGNDKLCQVEGNVGQLQFLGGLGLVLPDNRIVDRAKTIKAEHVLRLK